MRALIVVISLLCCASALAAPSPPAAALAGAASILEQPAQVVDILGGNYFFRPDRVTVKVNVPVEFRVRRAPGMVPHNFVIDAPEAGVQLSETMPKSARSVRATFTRPGEYTFYCSRRLLFFQSHRDRGMVGTIVVTP